MNGSNENNGIRGKYLNCVRMRSSTVWGWAWGVSHWREPRPAGHLEAIQAWMGPAWRGFASGGGKPPDTNPTAGRWSIGRRRPGRCKPFDGLPLLATKNHTNQYYYFKLIVRQSQIIPAERVTCWINHLMPTTSRRWYFELRLFVLDSFRLETKPCRIW